MSSLSSIITAANTASPVQAQGADSSQDTSAASAGTDAAVFSMLLSQLMCCVNQPAAQQPAASTQQSAASSSSTGYSAQDAAAASITTQPDATQVAADSTQASKDQAGTQPSDKTNAPGREDATATGQKKPIFGAPESADQAKNAQQQTVQNAGAASVQNPQDAQHAKIQANPAAATDSDDQATDAAKSPVPSIPTGHVVPIGSQQNSAGQFSTGSENNGDNGRTGAEGAKNNASELASLKTDFNAQFHQASVDTNTQQSQPAQPEAQTANASAMRAADRVDAMREAMTSQKSSDSLSVQVNHDRLGPLNIDLSMSKGMLNAQITTHDDAARTLLQNNSHRIVQSLMSEGLSVGGFSVGLRQNSSGNSGEQDQQQPANRLSASIAKTQAIVAAARTGQGRVSIII
jgi:hypothetical protein